VTAALDRVVFPGLTPWDVFGDLRGFCKASNQAESPFLAVGGPHGRRNPDSRRQPHAKKAQRQYPLSFVDRYFVM